MCTQARGTIRNYDELASGRSYVQSDPIGLRGGSSTYAYVRNAPAYKADRMGLCECQPGKRKFETQHGAARSITEAENPSSIDEHVEHCGNVCMDEESGQYFTTGPIIGNSITCDPRAVPCPSCSKWVAYWHTHGGYDPGVNNENFTPGDLYYADQNGVDGYVGTPQGQFKYYPSRSDSPQTLLPPLWPR